MQLSSFGVELRSLLVDREVKVRAAGQKLVAAVKLELKISNLSRTHTHTLIQAVL